MFEPLPASVFACPKGCKDWVRNIERLGEIFYYRCLLCLHVWSVDMTQLSRGL